jgi:hypothetical protein
MVFCPTCGSSQITLQRESNIDWGRAATGWLLFGVVGGALGAVTGEERSANACLNCGNTWKAAILFNQLQTIQKLVGRTLDLSIDGHRQYYREFVVKIEPNLFPVSLTIERLRKDFEMDVKSMKAGLTPSKWVPAVFIVLFIGSMLVHIVNLAIAMIVLCPISYLYCFFIIDKIWLKSQEQKLNNFMIKKGHWVGGRIEEEQLKLRNLARSFDQQYRNLL